MTKRWMLDRRTVLRAAGAAVALPMLDAMVAPRRAHAAPARRFWLSFSPNGAIAPEITPPGGERDFTLPSCLRPLAPFRDDLLLVFGLDNRSNGKSSPGVGHYAGGPTCLTGEPLLNGGKVKGSRDSDGYDVGGISLDQAIAASPAGETRFRSISAGHSGQFLVNYLCAAGKGRVIPNEPDAEKLYAKLFSTVPAGGGQTGPSPELLRLRKRRGTVLDLVKGQIDGLRARVGVDDRRLLDAHHEGIRDVERSLDLATQPVSAGCSNPGAVDGVRLAGETPGLDRVVPLFLKLEAYAFRCDLTRVITNMWVKSSSRQSYGWIGVPELHHELSHESAPSALAKQAKIDTWWCQVMADFIELLKAMPEAGGKTVFDSTVVIWAHELANGDTHGSSAIPWVMAGSAGGAFRTGRFLDYRGQGRSTNDLLAALGRGFGLPGATFGRPEYNRGPLPLG